jgi:hypothetical protein
MSSKSHLSYAERSKSHLHPLARTLFSLAERKKTNIVLSADLTTSKELLDIANCESFSSDRVRFSLLSLTAPVIPRDLSKF